MKTVWEWIKPVAGAVVIILLLKVTGLLGSVASFSQSVVMKTGALDADDKEIAAKENFQYNFSIKDLSGKRVHIGQYKNKVLFINLWATWCGPCRAEMPTIQKLYDKVDKDKVVFIMLSIDRDSDQQKVIRYIEKNAYSFPVYMPSGYLTEQLNVGSIPTTLVVDKEGYIVRREVGTTNFDTPKFKKFLERLAVD